jgi:hypothetical protein
MPRVYRSYHDVKQQNLPVRFSLTQGSFMARFSGGFQSRPWLRSAEWIDAPNHSQTASAATVKIK